MVFPRQPERSATVFLDGENIGINSNDFSLSSSGMQFVSNTPVSQYKVVELTFAVGHNTPVTSMPAHAAGEAFPHKHPGCKTVNCSA